MAEDFTAKFSVDISDLKKNISEANKQIKLANATFKAETAGMDDWSKNADGLSKKLQQLDKTLAAQKSKLASYQSQLERQEKAYDENGKRADALRTKLQQLASQGVDKASDEYKTLEKALRNIITAQDNNGKAADDLRIKILNQQSAVGKTEKDIRNFGKALTDLEKEANGTAGGLDDVGDAAKGAGEDAEKGSDGFTVFKGVVADLSARVITAAISGLKKLGEKMIEVGKDAIESYADYEQLVGGVETLFKDSAPVVLKYAQDAYKTAGMSANEYMENITGFSASLLQGLGGDTKKAAQIGDLAIRDMSDNANKMGSDIESITRAYQGFAKQNYAMLDNLKLGYGGSASEMARLVNESGVMGKAFEATAETVKNVPFDKLIEAIHVVQTNMGITGTTAKEASETISGSVASMRASWSNLLTSIVSDNGDIDKSIDQFSDTAITAVNNIAPRIRNFAKAFKEIVRNIVQNVFPKLKKEIPELEPLINIFEWFIKNRAAVGGALKFIIAAFAAKKIYDFAKGIVEVAKGIKTVMTMLTSNPWALAIAGIGLLITAIATATNKTDDLSDEMKALDDRINKVRDSVTDQKRAIEDLDAARDEALSKGLHELGYYNTLKEELQNITDANGKVKKGYEERAEFIVNQLAEGLGLEITLQDGVIKKYQETIDTIDELVKKKKNSLIMEVNEAGYKNAIEQIGTAESNLITAYNELRDAQNKRLPESMLNEIKQNYTDTLNVYLRFKDGIDKYEKSLYDFEQNLPVSVINWNEVESKVAEMSERERNTALQRAIEGKGIGDFARKAQEEVGEVFKTVNTEITKNVTETAKKLRGQTEVTLKQAVFGLHPTAKKAVKGVVQVMVDGVAVGLPILESEAQKILDSLDKQLEEGTLDVKDYKSALIAAFTPTSTEKADTLRQYTALGTAAISGLIAGFKSKINNMTLLKDEIIKLGDEIGEGLGAAVIKSSLSGAAIAEAAAVGGTVTNNTKLVTYNQYNNSPTALSRIDIYRDTRNLLTLTE